MPQIVHIVLVAWKDPDGAVAAVNRLVDRHLPGLDGVVSLDRGAEIGAEGLAGGFDWGLVVRFADAQALAAYGPHPEHLVVAEYIRAESERFVVFDFDAAA